MRLALLLIALGAGTALAFQDNDAGPTRRYGFEPNLDKYPQQQHDQALQSVVKALQENRIDYLLAQLADPEFVDQRVAENARHYQGKDEAKKVLAFNLLVKQTSEHFRDDPTLLRELRRISEEGEWTVDGEQAVARFALLPGRAVHMKQINGRWFLENKQK